MKIYRFLSALFIPVMMASVFMISSCDDSSDSPVNGAPEVFYVRVPDPAAGDSLLVSAPLGRNVVIVGNNLADTRDIWFNDQQANISPTWVTNNTIHVNIPSAAPTNVTNKMYLINGSSDTAAFDFAVAIAAPRLDFAKNEWPLPGENLVIEGDFFFEPISISYMGDVAGEVVSVSQNKVEFTVPDGAQTGPVTVTTNFGQAVSTFEVWDQRNIFLDFDVTNGNGWRQGLNESADGPIDGEYLVIRGNIDANQRVEGDGASPLLMEYWGTDDPNNTYLGNFYEGYYADYVLKFEAKVNQWYGGHLNICLAPYSHTGSNQEIWSNDINARAVWAPWEAEGESFSTDGGWITVTIPMLDFQNYMGADDTDGVFYTPGQKFVETAAGSLSTWMLGSPENDGSLVEYYIDNIRIVTP